MANSYSEAHEVKLTKPVTSKNRPCRGTNIRGQLISHGEQCKLKTATTAWKPERGNCNFRLHVHRKQLMEAGETP